ncbi:MAG: hypothetical protein USCGTAYLOR_01419 [Chromatiales bacterium USCg_Taylor]|nr:MAG: hypothetical protein USCGTAYLOR_01419 [Chromatiales bacterium USCg_Taylor]
MFEVILRWPMVSHTVQTVSQRLRRLLRRLVMPLAVAALVFFGLAIYWSIRPDIFDVREAALRQSGEDPKKLVRGAVTTATLIEVANSLLEKRGGFLSNDINPVSLWLDNMPHWEFGALVQMRDFARVLRNDFGRSQSQSKEDPHLATADPQFHFNHESWIFPTTEGQYREGIEALKRYLVRLENGDARFFVRNDNLRSLLELVAKRLGDLAHRLSGSVGIEDLDTYAIWDLTDKAAPQASPVAFKTPWLHIDDVFYEARGATWALLHFMYAIQIDFAPVLHDRKAMVSFKQIIRKLDQAERRMWSPIVLNGTGYGVVANHSLVLASYISRADSAVIDLLDLLRQ